MKKLVLILLILISAALAGTAAAQEQTNPRRKSIEEFERMFREMKTGGSVQANDMDGLQAVCTQRPLMYGTGKWNISLAGHTPSQVKRMIARLSYRDWCSDYSIVHWVEKDRDNGDAAPFMNSYATPKILTSGEYEFVTYAIFTDGTAAFYAQEFTVAGVNELQNKINSVAAACKADTQWQTALNLHDWLTNNMYYDYSLSFYGADSILRGYGVCDSYAKDYLMLCRAAGIPVYRVVNENHAWNAVLLDGEWYYVDCTWDDPGSEKVGASGKERHNYFCVNDTLLGLDHPQPWSWAYYSRQACTSLDANYLIHTGEWKTWGVNYTYNAATKVYRVIPFREEIAGAISNGSAAVTFENRTWWSGGGTGIRGSRPDDYKRICLVYALNRDSVPVSEADKARISAAWRKQDNAITVQLTGWDIQETGTLTLPENLKVVPEEAFLGNGATTLVISPGCEAIRGNAFGNSRLRTVSVPESVTQIAENAFAGCGKIIFRTSNPVAVRFAAEHRMPVLSP